MMKRTITIFILLTGLLAKKYLIEVADEGGDQTGDQAGAEVAEEEGGDEGGSDFSLNRNLKMVLDGQLYYTFLGFYHLLKSLS